MVLQSLLALSAVLGLFALMVWAMRRFQQHTGNNMPRDFKVVQRIHIDNKNSIVEIRHRGAHYLLGLSPGGLTQLRPDQTLPLSEATAAELPDETT
ncbi:flagellar biosynthetic protein FliO [Mariprofundus micogutta]|nr:flagellar biosynthetic protein FliO [Mariprofundus micogutta]